MIPLMLLLLQTGVTAGTVPAEIPAKSKPKLICKTTMQTTSRIGARRECATAAEWEQRRRDDGQTINQLKGNLAPNSGG